SVRLSDISIKVWADDTGTLTALADNAGCISIPRTHNHGHDCDGHYGPGHGGDDFCHDHCDDDGNELNCDGGFVFGTAASAHHMATSCGPAPNQEANWEITISDNDHAMLPPGATWVAIGVAISPQHLFGHFSPGTADWYSACLSGWEYADT